jgi:oligogalacturonide transport system substrate-binding protein
MGRMKRIAAVVLMSAMVGGSFAGCGNSAGNGTAGTATLAPGNSTQGMAAGTVKSTAGSENESSAAADQEPVVLRFSWWGGDARAKATLAVIKQFHEKYPSITIKAEYGSSDGYNDRLTTQLSAGTAPDLIQLANTMPQFYKGQGGDYFVDLEKAGFDFSGFEPDYLKKANNGNCNGVQVGVPTGIAGSAFLINRDLAEKAGVGSIAAGATWQDLIEAGKKVQQYDPGLYLLCMNTDYIINLIIKPYFIQITGNGSFADEKNKRLLASEEDLQKCLELVQELYKSKVVPRAAYSAAYQKDTLQTDPNWIAGKYVSALTYVSTLEVMTDANRNANYIMGDLPVAETGKLWGWNTNCPQIMTVNRKSKHIKEAVLFLNYFFHNRAAMETLGTTRSVPPTPEARMLLTEKGLMNPLLQQAAEISMKNRGVIADRWTESTEGLAAFEQAVETVGYGICTPSKAAKDLLELLKGMVK